MMPKGRFQGQVCSERKTRERSPSAAQGISCTLAVVAVLCTGQVRGGDQGTLPPSTTPGVLRPDDLSRRVVILADQTTLLGEVRKRDNVYEIRTGSGVVFLPAARVWKVCDSLEEAYEHLRSRPVRDEVQSALQLARWCARHGLTAQARLEAERVLRLQPDHREARRLAGLSPADPPNLLPTVHLTEQPASTPSLGDSSDSNLQPSKKLPCESSEHRYSPETLRSFVQRVQPILFNSCATAACHGGNRGLVFELQRPPSTGILQPAVTRNNLVQTLRFVDSEDPANSELLRKALKAHGGRPKPPLPGKDSPAYQTLESWVLSVCPPRQPMPLDGDIAEPSRSVPNEPPSDPAKLPSAQAGFDSEPSLPPPLRERFATTRHVFAAESDTPAATPLASPNSSDHQPDAYDPTPFNARYHPKRGQAAVK